MDFKVYKLSLMKHAFLKNEYYLISSAVTFQNFHEKVGKLCFKSININRVTIYLIIQTKTLLRDKRSSNNNTMGPQEKAETATGKTKGLVTFNKSNFNAVI